MIKIHGFLIDLDGVLYTGEQPIKGADEAIRFLEESGCPYRFVSNTTRKCRHSIAEKLLRMGLEIPEESIFTPAVAAVEYMKNTGRRRYRLLVTGDVDHDFPPATHNDGDNTTDYVIIGDAGDEITYASMNAAFRDLIQGAGIIALEKDRYWMAPDGLSLSAGPFVSALEYATGKSAALMGKPSRDFFGLALMDMGISADQGIMIGDDIQTDVGGAQAAGMRGVLVRTGKYREEILKTSKIQPDLIIDSIAGIRQVIAAADEERWERHL